jgi:chromodomain-helicase-DNA-binding protein 7
LLDHFLKPNQQLNYGSLGYYSRIDEPPQGAAAEEASGKSKQKKKKSSKGGGHGEDDDSDDYVEGGEDSESSSSDSDSDDADDPVDLEISTGPAASEESEDEDEDGEKKPASIPAAPRSSSHASEPSSATPLSPLSSEPSSAKMEDDAAAAEADEEDGEDGEDEDEDEDDDDDDDDDDVGSGGGCSRPRKQTKDKKKKKGSSSLASSSLSSSVSAESEAKAAKAGLRAKEKRAKRLVVLESEWLAAGHMERLLLAVERCPHKPQSDAWADTGLEPPRDLEKEAAQAAEAVAASSSVMDGEASTSNKELASGQSVAQYDLDTGKVLKVWPSGNTAAKSMGVPLAMLRDACISGVEVAGYRWEPFVSAAEETEGSSSSSSSSGGGSSGAGGSPEKKTKKKERDDGVFQYSDSLTYKGDNKLRDYQLNGLNWLLLCHHYKRSCILADEMGLGKTVQVVSFLEHLCTVDKLRGPFLVVVPLSTVGHWEREFASWTDLNVCMYHDGGRDMRALIRAFEWYQDGRAPQFGSSSRLKFQVLITTYDEVIKDVDQLGAVPWRGLIVDEAHRLKGVTSKLLESLNQILPLGVQQHGTQHRLLMTGTPLQNNTKELWSLLNFIEPSKFTSLENFQETYEEMDSEYQVRSLQQRLAPHLLRRVKEDVATDIPAKFETVIDVELTTIQKQYYRAIFEKNQAFLARAARGAVVPKLMNIQMELRKCCNHPYLIEGVESREAELLQEELVNEAAAAASGSSGASRAAAAGGDNSLTLPASIIPEAQFKRAWLERCLLRSSGKMVLLDKLLPKVKFSHLLSVVAFFKTCLESSPHFCFSCTTPP